MNNAPSLTHKFIDYIPDHIEEGTVYISIEYDTVVHKCGCGCGHEVVTPLSPTDWKLTYDGESVSLHPSIGNWSFSCQSHYWIIRNKIVYAESWTEQKIRENRQNDRMSKRNHSQSINQQSLSQKTPAATSPNHEQESAWNRIVKYFKGLCSKDSQS